MSVKQYNNFPTFPCSEETDPRRTGLTYLDYMAGQALMGMLAADGNNPRWVPREAKDPESQPGGGKWMEPTGLSRQAYAIALAMMQTRWLVLEHNVPVDDLGDFIDEDFLQRIGFHASGDAYIYGGHPTSHCRVTVQRSNTRMWRVSSETKPYEPVTVEMEMREEFWSFAIHNQFRNYLK